MSHHDLVVLGDCNPDLLLSGDVIPRFGQAEQLLDATELTIGGSGAIVAAGAARLGLNTALIGLVGDDELGRIQLDALRARSVDVGGVVVDPGVSTGLSVVLSSGGDRAILTRPGAVGAFHADLVDRELLGSARHVHASSYFLQVGMHTGLPALLSEAREAGAAVSLDTNWDPSGGWNGGLRTLLSLVDCLLPNAEEARRITSTDSPRAAAAALAAQVPTVAVKRGAAGALARSGDAVAEASALDVEVVDTTGAGDAFNAGFIAGRVRGEDLGACLGLAVACGSLSVRALGVDGQPTLEEAERARQAAAR